MKRYTLLVTLVAVLGLLFFVNSAYSQGFGRNKPKYRTFDFKIRETPNFSIYNYLKNGDKVDEIGQQAELWYDLHQAVFQDTLYGKNPIILYNNHADFQQTNAISGSVGVGTGGVTEAFKNRIIYPLTFTNQQNFHVLGHEMVHAFQYNTIINGDSTSLRSLQNLPLWMVEGLAEYLSKGRVDPFTAMWMRDAVMNKDVPSLEDLYNPEYFPYRYGQVFWSFITGTFGDEVIKPLFRNTAIFGLHMAIDSTLGVSYRQLDTMWVNSIKNHYGKFIKYDKENVVGKNLISKKNAGKMNVSPAISPNGKYVIFISEKDVFTTDWYLAKAHNGEIIRKISSRIKDAHIDNYNFMESSGTWSPNSKKFAFVAFKKGRNILVIKEAKSGKTLDEISLKEVRAFTNPNWSPDGKNIVVTGLVQGQVDLFSYNLKTKKIKQLTDDSYCEIQSDFSTDGRKLVFSTDRLSMKQGMQGGRYHFNIGVLDIETGRKSDINLFVGADNLNPIFDKDDNLYFLSNRDGYRNMYKYDFSKGKVFQETDFVIGISGITEFSPAISISKKKDRILYTLYGDNEYSIYKTTADKLLNKVVGINDVDFTAGMLPAPNEGVTDVVNANLAKISRLRKESASAFTHGKYKPKFKLDYIGGGTAVGVGNSTFGTYTGLVGGVDLLFSDMLGNHQLYSRIAINGEIYDFGGQLVYMNRKSRVSWGVGLSHIPYTTGNRTVEYNVPKLYGNDTIPTDVLHTNILRVFNERLSVFWHYPFSTTLRIEGGVDGGFRSFRYDRISDYYYANSYPYNYLGQEREKVPINDTVAFGNYYRLIKGFSSSLNVAIVGDNSYNGLTSPLAGYKYRVALDKHFGADDYQSILADFRYYHWVKPVSFALRGFFYSRFEGNVNSVYPIYIGQMGFVRGYNPSFSSKSILDNYDYVDHLLGSKVLMSNFEIRFPFSGIERLALIKSKFFFSDLALFFDIGVAFDEFSHFDTGEKILIKDGSGLPKPIYVKPKLVKSAGVALRVNLFGALVVEPYLAYPIEENSKFVFGLNFMPGF